MNESRDDTSLTDLAHEVRAFCTARNWERFHDAKNLTMALAGEVGELCSELQWVPATDLESVLADGTEARKRFEEETADVFIYLLRIVDVVGIDLPEATRTKLALNEKRYPVAQAFGVSVKYSRLDRPNKEN